MILHLQFCYIKDNESIIIGKYSVCTIILDAFNMYFISTNHFQHLNLFVILVYVPHNFINLYVEREITMKGQVKIEKY